MRMTLASLGFLLLYAGQGAILSCAQSSREPDDFGPFADLVDNHHRVNGALSFAKLFPNPAPALVSRQLSLGDRIAYQRAIEEVYWHHRIWPNERPDLKPSLDEVMPPVQIEQKVENYLSNSQALEDHWKSPIRAEQLQGEMERLAQHTKQPEVLRALFEALGNDPFVIAECLARPILSERVLTNFCTREQGRGESFESWKARAENQLPRVMAAPAADYTLPVISNTVNSSIEGARTATSITNALTSTQGYVADTWTATSINNAPSARSQHSVVWTGSEMIIWGGFTFGGIVSSGGRYSPSTDTWTATSTLNAPSARSDPTAVWTGTEMIVWGGDARPNGTLLNTGGRYNPGTDSWTATNANDAPTGRYVHTAVWTGTEMIVWGGWGESDVYNTGGRYNPRTDSWTATSVNNAPSARSDHTAVWTGTEMIVWGGFTKTGGRYNPSTDSWSATGIINAPSARTSHTAVWTGAEMIVWGGYFNNTFKSGGRYNPVTDSWAATNISAPSARHSHTAVWTGNEMIIWGGNASTSGASPLNTGGRYNPGTDSWIATNTTNAPAAPSTAVWTGTEMMVWGGYDGNVVYNSGGRYFLGNTYPWIATQPQNQVITATNNVTISALAGGAAPLTYKWILNGVALPNATTSTLTLNNVALSNAGTYTLLVSNAYGQVLSAPARLTVLSNLDGDVSKPQYPPAPTAPSGKDSLVFITHGRTYSTAPSETAWVDTMKNTILSNVPSNWFVVPYKWTELSTTASDFGLTRILSHAKTAGVKAASDIIDLAQFTTNQRWEHVHLIAHSAGAALVEEIAKRLRQRFPNADIQTTLLDPFHGLLGLSGSYGTYSTWTDNYYDIDFDTHDSPWGRTDGVLQHAYNVDVTGLDLAATIIPFWCGNSGSPPPGSPSPCGFSRLSSHGWPIAFYQNTIPPQSQGGSNGYGFPLSREAGGQTTYAPNTQPVILGGGRSVIQGSTPTTSSSQLDFNSVPHGISSTGSIQVSSNGFSAVTGALARSDLRTENLTRIQNPRIHPLPHASSTTSPAWISIPVDVNGPISYVSCDVAFTGATGSSGLVTVYWNDLEIGTIDQDYLTDPTATYVFEVGETYQDRNNCLGFRLDGFSDVSASINVSNVKTGVAGLPQTAALSITRTQNGDQVITLTGSHGYTFLIQASNNLTDWTPIANAGLDDGSTAQFTDLNGGSAPKRFYRAVSP